MNRYLLSLLALLISFNSKAQITGGDNVYEFLNLPTSARITGLGGNLITVQDDDINLAFANPAALNPSMHTQLSFSHSFHLADIQHGYVGFGYFHKKLDLTFHGGMQYLTYGQFKQTDEVGNILGEFDAAEYAFTLGAGKQLYEKLSVGANLKFITSRFESYNSVGLTGDLALMFHDTSSRINITLLAKNLGGQLSTYTPDNPEPIPFEMQIGVSKRLRHLPFRFSIIYHNLGQWNILYDDPNSVEDVSFIDPNATTGSGNDFFENLFRHFIFSGEFLFGKRELLRLRIAYNHHRRQELTVRNLRSVAGFSLGAGIKINRFRIDYGRSFYHLAGGQNHFTLSTNFGEFKKN